MKLSTPRNQIRVDHITTAWFQVFKLNSNLQLYNKLNYIKRTTIWIELVKKRKQWEEKKNYIKTAMKKNIRIISKYKYVAAFQTVISASNFVRLETRQLSDEFWKKFRKFCNLNCWLCQIIILWKKPFSSD